MVASTGAERMRILVVNDDGIHASGIHALSAALEPFAEVFVVAPDRDCSGASHSLTLKQPLRLHHLSSHRIAVEGTPTDCVHLALTGLLPRLPDIVISGINLGANMGEDVLYSGTVGAAVEACILGYPSIAISLTRTTGIAHFDTAAAVLKQVMDKQVAQPLDPHVILNINVPSVPKEELKGIQLTELGKRRPPEPRVEALDPRGLPMYWIGRASPPTEAGSAKGTDFYAINQGFASVTPLHHQLTCRATLSRLLGDSELECLVNLDSA